MTSNGVGEITARFLEAPVSMFNQAGNGALLAMICFGMAYVVHYLYRGWRDRPEHATIRVFYTYSNKAAFGLLTMLFGFGVKTAAVVVGGVVMKHGITPDFHLLSTMIVSGTLIGLWGIICLLRSITPYEWRSHTWLWILIGTLLIGGAFAL